MTNEILAAHVDGHSCRIRGIHYRFKLRWAAAEQYSDPAPARHLLRVEASADGEPGDQAISLHVLAWVNNPGDLPVLLTDALQHHLMEQGIKEAVRASA